MNQKKLSQSFKRLREAQTPDEIVQYLIECVYYQENKTGEPPSSTLEQIQAFTQPHALPPNTVVIAAGDHYECYTIREGKSLEEIVKERERPLLETSFSLLNEILSKGAPCTIQDSQISIEAPAVNSESGKRYLQSLEAAIKALATPKGCGDFNHFATYLLMTAGEPTPARLLWLNKAWAIALKDNPDLKHPSAPLARAWLTEQMPRVEIEKREKQIAPAFLKGSRITKGDRLPTGFLHTQGTDSPQLQLPSFDGTEDDIVVHALPLEMYQGGGGGRGAPLDERIFFNALLARPYGTPELWNGVKLEPTLRNFVDWLYPNGWNRTNQLPLLRKALHDVNNKRISYERRDWNVVQVLAMPNQSTALDDVLPLIIRYPDGVKGNGPMINVPRLRQYGLVSATKWRAWIRLHYLWDTANQRNGGNKIHSTIKKVKKNDKGYLLDAQGNLILTGAPYKTTPGRWAVRRGDKPQTAWYHPQAIHIENERNPQCDKIPVLTDKQLVALFYDDTPVDVASFSERKKVAMDGLMDFEEDGVVVVERDAIDTKRGVKGWRIIPVYQH